jgi:hypothetical protein
MLSVNWLSGYCRRDEGKVIEILMILVLLVACMGLAYEVRKRGEDLERLAQAHRQELEEQRQAQRRALEELQAQHENTVAQINNNHRLEIERLQSRHQRELAEQQKLAVAARPAPVDLREEQRKLSRRQWMDGLSKVPYRNDVEVDVKFVYPLVRFLGYDLDGFSLQVPLDLRLGRQTRTGQADWVLWRNNGAGDDHAARAIIEVLSPSQELDEAVQEQARALAVGAGAPFYLLTNGKRIQLFRRDMRADQLLIDCPLAEFPECWPQIHDLLGVR